MGRKRRKQKSANVLMDNWKKLEKAGRGSSEMLAAAYFAVTEGDETLLESNDWMSSSGVWGDIAQELFNENRQAERMHLYLVWRDNRKKIKKNYFDIAGETNLVPVFRRRLTNGVYCYCQKFRQPLNEQPENFIQCDFCEKWFHFVCVNIPCEQQPSYFKCPLCKGKKDVPKIFNESISSIKNAVLEYSFMQEIGYRRTTVHSQSSAEEMCPTVTKNIPQTSGKNNADNKEFDKSNKTKQTSKSRENIDFEIPSENETRCPNRVFIDEHSDPNLQTPRETTCDSHSRGHRIIGESGTDSEGDDEIYSDTEAFQTSKFQDCKTDSNAAFKAEQCNHDAETNKKPKNDKNANLHNQSQQECNAGENANNFDDDYHRDGVSIIGDSDNDSCDEADTHNDQERPMTSKTAENSEKPEQAKDKFENRFSAGNFKSEEEDCNDTSEQPANFVVDIPWKSWCKMMKFSDQININQGKHRINGDRFSDMLAAKFNEVNKGCVLSFTKTRLRHPCDMIGRLGRYLSTYADCIQEDCFARYVLYIQNLPKPLKPIKVYCKRLQKPKGPHDPSKPAYRKLRGHARKQVQKRLRFQKPSRVRLEDYIDANPEMLKTGNLNNVRSKRSYQHAKAEERKEKELHEDPIIDVILQKFAFDKEYQDKILPGYCQTLDLSTFSMNLFLRSGVDIFYDLSKLSRVSIFLDATSNFCVPVKLSGGVKRLFYYAMVVKATIPGNAPISVAGCLSATQRAIIIHNLLSSFFFSYSSVYKDVRQLKDIVRFEIDFSLPLLGGIITYFHGPETEDYFVELWRGFIKKRPSRVVGIHMCKFHMIRTMTKKIGKVCLGNPNRAAVENFWIKTARRLLLTRSLEGFFRITLDIIVVGGSKYVTPQVQERINQISVTTSRTEFSFQPNLPQTNEIQLSELRNMDNFWQRSPFGAYFRLAKRQVLETTKSFESEYDSKILKDDNLEFNIFKSNKLLRYFSRYIFPYFPIVSRAIFNILDINDRDDTQSAVENYFKILKSDLGFDNNNMKVGSFLRDHANITNGMHERFKTEVLNKAKGKPNKPNPSHCKSNSSNDRKRKQSEPEAQPTEEPEDDFGPPMFSSTPKRRKTQRRNSPDGKEEKFKQRRTRKTENKKLVEKLMKLPVLPWGQFYMGVQELINTCPIDNGLQLIFTLYKITSVGKEYFDIVTQMKPNHLACELPRMFKAMEKFDFDSVKTIFIDAVRKSRNVSECLPKRPASNFINWNLESTEMVFYSHIFPWFSLWQEDKCNNQNCANYGLVQKCTEKNFGNVSCSNLTSAVDDTNSTRNVSRKGCGICGLPVVRAFRWKNDQPLSIIPLLFLSHFSNKELRFLPSDLRLDEPVEILGKLYKVFAYTLLDAGRFHFVTVFNTSPKLIYDGLNVPYCTGGKNVTKGMLGKGEYKPVGLVQVTSLWLIEEENIIID